MMFDLYDEMEKVSGNTHAISILADEAQTYLDSLSGDSKALMFVNVSTDADDVPETLCSLRFAARAHDVALGQAKKNVAPARAASPMGRPPRTPERR